LAAVSRGLVGMGVALRMGKLAVRAGAPPDWNVVDWDVVDWNLVDIELKFLVMQNSQLKLVFPFVVQYHPSCPVASGDHQCRSEVKSEACCRWHG